MVGPLIENRSVRRLALVSAFGALALGAGDAAALSGGTLDPAPPLFQLVQDPPLFRLIQDKGDQPVQDPGGGSAGSGPARPDAAQTPSFPELNDALAATRAKVETLARAAEMAKTVGELRQRLSDARTENQRLVGELARARAAAAERQRTREAADERIAELATAAHQVAAEAARKRQELTDTTRRNADLERRLADAEAELALAKARIEDADVATAARMRELIDASEQSDAELAQLRDRLMATEQRIGDLVRARSDAEARLAELQPDLEAARQEVGRLGGQLSRAQAEVARAGEARAAAEEQRDAAGLQTEFLARRLRAELAAANGRLRQAMAENGELEAEIASLRASAAVAADAARENMLAVASRIDALDAAFGGVAPAAAAGGDQVASAGELPPATPEPVDAAIELPATEAAIGRPGSTQASPRDQANGAADVAGSRLSRTSNRAPDPAEGPGPEPSAAPGPFTELTVGLAPDARRQARTLLEELDAKAGGRGLMVTVPGAALFESGSETVGEAAHALLAKLAELAKLYADRDLLIVGHTDANGDAAYNRYLSTRRAEVIRDFLVGNFELEETRLAIEGRGEEQPIASNATPDGRMANRRVEVLLLN